ncbi:MAG: hypothetical protein R3B72_23070 [Polyangiaceae bacterium]
MSPRRAATLALLLLVAVIVWRWPSRLASPSARGIAPATRASDAGPSGAAFVPVAASRVAAPSPHDGAAARRAEAEAARDAYLESARYPPHSRPLSRAQGDLLDPERRHDRVRRSVEDAQASYLLTADRYRVIGEESLGLELSAERAGRPAMVRVEAVEVVELGGHGRWSLPDLAGTGAPWRGAVSAASLEIAHGAQIRVEVTFAIDGSAPEMAVLNASIRPTSASPGAFTGRFTSEEVEGSLVVEAEVEVTRAGWFVLDANLWDAEGEPVAWSRAKRALEVGRAWVRFEFFGRVLVERGARAPFRVAQLRGERIALDEEPAELPLDRYEGDYTTPDFPRSRWSDAAWDSPAKRRKLDKLAEIAARGDGPLVVPARR